MGLWDFIASMFGGGAKMDLELDSKSVPEGGLLSGTLKLSGAGKTYTANTVKVQLVYVHTEKVEDSPLPKIDFKVLLDNTLATNVAVPAEGSKDIPFSFAIPPGTEPTGSGTTYQVKVVADIPGIKDPNKVMELEVLEREEGSGLTVEGLYARWPALRGTAEQPLLQAIRDMQWRNETGDAENDLLVAEPILARLMKTGSPEVRREAVETWANILRDRVRTEHVKALTDMAAASEDDPETLEAAIRASSFIVDMGGFGIVEKYAGHGDIRIRRAAADACGWGGPYPAKKKLALKLVEDESAEVRTRAISALGNYYEDKDVMAKVVSVALTDPSPDVLAKSLSALALQWHYGNPDQVAPVWQKAAAHPDSEVREAWIHWCSYPGKKGDIGPTISAMLADPVDSVREQMAFQFINFLDDFPQYVPLCQAVANGNDTEKVRANAISALARHMPVGDVVPWLRELVAQGAPRRIQTDFLFGLRGRKDPLVREFLTELTQSQIVDVAKRARETLEDMD